MSRGDLACLLVLVVFLLSAWALSIVVRVGRRPK